MYQPALRNLLISLLLGCGVCAAAAASDCPAAGFAVPDLRQAKLQGWKAADAGRQQALALGLLPCLSHPDPEIRDGLAFEGLSAMLRGKFLSLETRYQVYRTQLAQLGATTADADGFARPFAALVLSEVARTDRLQPFLEASERTTLVNAAVAYMHGITDYRGFTPGEGWRHGVAHGADLLMQLALNPATDRDQLAVIAQAARAQIVAGQSHSYIHGESDRLARPIVFAARRGLLEATYWRQFVAAIAAPEPLTRWDDAFTSQAGLARLHNTKGFLRAALALVNQLNNSGVTALLAQPLNAALAQLP